MPSADPATATTAVEQIDLSDWGPCKAPVRRPPAARPEKDVAQGVRLLSLVREAGYETPSQVVAALPAAAIREDERIVALIAERDDALQERRVTEQKCAEMKAEIARLQRRIDQETRHLVVEASLTIERGEAATYPPVAILELGEEGLLPVAPLDQLGHQSRHGITARDDAVQEDDDIAVEVSDSEGEGESLSDAYSRLVPDPTNEFDEVCLKFLVERPNEWAALHKELLKCEFDGTPKIPTVEALRRRYTRSLALGRIELKSPLARGVFDEGIREGIALVPANGPDSMRPWHVIQRHLESKAYGEALPPNETIQSYWRRKHGRFWTAAEDQGLRQAVETGLTAPGEASRGAAVDAAVGRGADRGGGS
jgi:hypothetical protein